MQLHGDGSGFVHDFSAIQRHGPDLMRASLDWLAEVAGYDLGAVDWFIPPQVGSAMTDAVVDQLGMPAARVVNDFPRVGNTVSAGIYLALERLRSEARLEAGQRVVLLPAEATKWTYGVVVLRWDAPTSPE